MERFKDVLVAVDLEQGDRLVADILSPSCAVAVERALFLAELNSAQLTFFYTFDVSPAGQRLIEESGQNGLTIVDEAKSILSWLVERATARGIVADFDVCFGKSWLEIIRRVLRQHHDLVVAGTRHLGAVHSMLIGSTGIKLLRKCPCPVWITQPPWDQQIKSVLVAHCLRSVGNTAMELGCSIASHHDAQLHVLHSLEYPELDSMFPSGITSEKIAQYRSAAEEHLRSQLAASISNSPPNCTLSQRRQSLLFLNTYKNIKSICW